MSKDEELKMAGYDLDGVIADVEKFDGFDDVCLQTIKRVRSTIAKALEAEQERNFCSRCGKRASKDPNHIHTCTPPQPLEQPAQEPVALSTSNNPFNSERHGLEVLRNTHPHQWQGLTDDEIARLVLINEVDKSGDTGFAKLIQQALKEKNT
jgi:hypothetical protein